MKKADPSALASALEQFRPTKKMSLVRSLVPQIAEARQRGLSKKEVWEALKAAGLELSYSNFMTYLYRIEAQNQAAHSIAFERVQGTQAGAGSSAPAASTQGAPVVNEIEAPAAQEGATAGAQENQGLSESHAALAEVRKNAGTKDYSKIMRDKERSKK